MKTKLPIQNRWLITVVCLVSALGFSYAQPKDTPPNIVFVLTDDQGYGELGCHGHPYLKTPNLDVFSEESVRFDNFYVSPSCSPTRAALLTGMHEFRSGVTHTMVPREHLNLSAITLPNLLKSAGYKTAHFGKWHLGYGNGHDPQFRGFDLSVRCGTRGEAPVLKDGFSAHHARPAALRKSFFDGGIIKNGKFEETKGFREDVLFNEAMDFMETNKDGPFFCFLATFSPHTPLGAPESFIEPYRGLVSEVDATYLGMVANIDYNMGRLMAKLKELELEENTVVLFMNDNGATCGLEMYNANMRGCKCTAWHGGTRAISFWRWPNRWKPKNIEQLSAHVDVLPTFCQLAGATVPPNLEKTLEGYSLVPLLESKGRGTMPKDRMVFQHVGRWPSGMAAEHKDAMAGVRQGDYLLVRSQPCDDAACTPAAGGAQCQSLKSVRKGSISGVYTDTNAQTHWGLTPGADGWSIYDVRKDPGCTNDLASEMPERMEKLKRSYYAAAH